MRPYGATAISLNRMDSWIHWFADLKHNVHLLHVWCCMLELLRTACTECWTEVERVPPALFCDVLAADDAKIQYYEYQGKLHKLHEVHTSPNITEFKRSIRDRNLARNAHVRYEMHRTLTGRENLDDLGIDGRKSLRSILCKQCSRMRRDIQIQICVLGKHTFIMRTMRPLGGLKLDSPDS
jgi:hypothetical protein